MEGDSSSGTLPSGHLENNPKVVYSGGLLPGKCYHHYSISALKCAWKTVSVKPTLTKSFFQETEINGVKLSTAIQNLPLWR